MLEDAIYQEYTDALKKRDKSKTDFLSFIRAELKNAAKALKKEKLDDEEALAVLKKQKKRLDETKESIATSGRNDLIAAVNQEIALIERYLPAALSQEELIAVIDGVIKDTGAASMKDMGRVMKEVLTKVGARVDSKQASELVKTRLSKS